MAYGKKYTMSFYTPEEELCKVDFYVEDYVGDATVLNPAENAFILREFNTDDDIFKPIRGQQAEISFVANNSISISDFIGNNDNYCYIEFSYYYTGSPSVYWVGYLMQDDFQEEWIDTNRIITLRASEGLGLQKSKQLYDANQTVGYNTFFTYIYNCVYEAAQVVNKYKFLYFINSLYNTANNSSIATSTLDQNYVDGRTFSTGDGEYEDKYTVLEKINKAWNQTIFQWKGRWYVLRLEDLYCPTSTNLRVNRWELAGFPDVWTISTQRFDINIGNSQSIKVIEPNMLRTINRQIKKTESDFYYNYPGEFIRNQNFKRGSLITSTSTYKTYTVSDWNFYTGTLASPTNSTGTHYRKDLLNSYGKVIDSYIIGNLGVGETTAWFQSEDKWINANDVLDISFNWRGAEGSTVLLGTYKVARVYIKHASNSYSYLNDDGTWTLVASPLSSDNQLTIKVDKSTTYDENAYIEKSILSKPVLKSGFLRILFTSPADPYSQLQFRYQGADGISNTSNIAGFKEEFVKSEEIKFNDIQEISFKDTGQPSPKIGNSSFNGSIIYDPGVIGTSPPLPTEPLWYRYRYNTEEFSFQKENLIARYNFNKFNRNKIDANFYGLKQGSQPIGLINTVIFTDDDPNKIYYIANMKEINFSAGTWSATLIEVWDSTKDPDTATTYPTYNTDFLYK